MTVRTSAGVLLYRRTRGFPEVLLVHPGGPIWAKRDAGAWMIPKGEIDPAEDPAAAAAREFAEELGSPPPSPLVPLATIRQKGGKQVIAFACEGDLDADLIASNHFRMEWPPRSGRFQSYPEVDRAAWFSLDDAREKLLESQRTLLDALRALIG